MIGILGQVWYLIVSIPDLCTLTFFEGESMTGSPVKNSSKSYKVIPKVISLLPPKICPKKECSDFVQKLRSSLVDLSYSGMPIKRL